MTRTPLSLMQWTKLIYTRWLLAHTEMDIMHMESQLDLFRREAERLRVEVCLLGNGQELQM